VIIDEVAPLLPSPLNDVALHLSLSGHFKPFATGSLYLSDVAFFLSAAFLTLFLSIRALSWR
jgi:ABC-2 type transport system permease protein